MSAFLAAMEYPCTRDDLLREAHRRGLSEAVALLHIPDVSYSGARDVVSATMRAGVSLLEAPARPVDIAS